MSQQATIMGRLGGDPEMKDTGKGVVMEMRVAVKSGREETTWWRASLWGKRAEGLNGKIGKGCRVLVIGRMATPKIFRKQNGDPGLDLTINADTVDIIDWADDANSGAQPQHQDTKASDWGNPKNADPVPF